ncbi:MAG: hypothetical protein RMX65_017160 [Nostoc sp. DedQUE01]|uniref:hypothetical protein n=1 Tax=Nostoc sp. CCY 9925 TaxID=3103865 RepID=UPI002AD70424|nr:hypothetical protein [Nostoc sp. DedQUE11]MDZ8072481.1 hypothetical protein [Nostoc sp. DedQUE01]
MNAGKVFDANIIDMCSASEILRHDCDRLFQSCLIQQFFDFSTSFSHPVGN